MSMKDRGAGSVGFVSLFAGLLRCSHLASGAPSVVGRDKPSGLVVPLRLLGNMRLAVLRNAVYKIDR